MDGPMAMRTLLKGTAMQIIVGPVLTRKGGYAFDCWTPQEGLSRRYTYGRIEDAHYARTVEIRYSKKGDSDGSMTYSNQFCLNERKNSIFPSEYLTFG
jgi:hypothetical protein